MAGWGICYVLVLEVDGEEGTHRLSDMTVTGL
jgi:hypothetical protein